MSIPADPMELLAECVVCGDVIIKNDDLPHGDQCRACAAATTYAQSICQHKYLGTLDYCTRCGAPRPGEGAEP